MFLGADIGNTNTTLGFFENDNLVCKINIPSVLNTEFEKNIIDVLRDKKISGCLISSVVDEITEGCRFLIRQQTNIEPIIFSNDFDLGMKIKAEHPEKIGSDRIINAYASGKLYSKPAVTVDMGTALTFDIIDSCGDFIGGIIAPGIQTQLISLNKNTSKLPCLDVSEFNKNSSVINTDTSKSILSGVIRGQALAIEGLIEECKKEMNSNPVVIGTGGYSELISNCLKHNKFDIINPNLTLYGLNLVYKSVIYRALP